MGVSESAVSTAGEVTPGGEAVPSCEGPVSPTGSGRHQRQECGGWGRSRAQSPFLRLQSALGTGNPFV